MDRVVEGKSKMFRGIYKKPHHIHESASMCSQWLSWIHCGFKYFTLALAYLMAMLSMQGTLLLLVSLNRAWAVCPTSTLLKINLFSSRTKMLLALQNSSEESWLLVSHRWCSSKMEAMSVNISGNERRKRNSERNNAGSNLRCGALRDFRPLTWLAHVSQ